MYKVEKLKVEFYIDHVTKLHQQLADKDRIISSLQESFKRDEYARMFPQPSPAPGTARSPGRENRVSKKYANNKDPVTGIVKPVAVIRKHRTVLDKDINKVVDIVKPKPKPNYGVVGDPIEEI